VLTVYPPGESEATVNLNNPPSFDAQDFKMTFLTALPELDLCIKCIFPVPLQENFKVRVPGQSIMNKLINGDLLSALKLNQISAK
jgi:hypothetical protein